MQEAEQHLGAGVYDIPTFSKPTSVKQVMDIPTYSDVFQPKVKIHNTLILPACFHAVAQLTIVTQVLVLYDRKT